MYCLPDNANVSAHMEAFSPVPRNKHDFERLNALVAAGPSAAVPFLDELLHWLQDINWPIAPPLADFLITVGEPLLPHLRKVLKSHDDMWIYWVLRYVVARLPPHLVRELREEIVALVGVAENDHVAFCVGSAAGVWDDQELRYMLANRIVAYEEYVRDLKAIQAKLGGR